MSSTLIAILVAVAVAALLVALWLFLRRRMREAGMYIIWRTKFGTALIFNVEGDDGVPVRTLNIKGMFQSATYLDERYTELIFAYYKLFDRVFDADMTINDTLMVGGGGYAYPKHFIATQPQARMDVVEIDPVITSIAQRYFFLDRLIEEYETEETNRLGLITADGRAYLDGLAAEGGHRYDVVFNDSFSGKSPASCMATVEAARSVKACLNEGGMFVSNVVSAVEGEGSRFLRAITATLGEVFEHVHVIPCGQDEFADRDNNIVIATDGAYTFTGEIPFEAGSGAQVLTDATADTIAQLAG